MKTHKFKTVFQKYTDLVWIITACGKKIDCRVGALDYAPTSVDWEDVDCKHCLKKKENK